MISTILALALAATTPASQPEEPGESAPAQEATKAEEERVCRHVRLDTSSRRKTKLCMTASEWREFNQGN